MIFDEFEEAFVFFVFAVNVFASLYHFQLNPFFSQTRAQKTATNIITLANNWIVINMI
jgi:hypothetical protein